MLILKEFWRTMNKTNNKTKGDIGEKIAKDYLEKKGYKILDTNFRYSRLSEIDIVAKEKDTIVFVEVKMRSTEEYGHPFEAITKQKLGRIYQTALFYLQQTEEKHRDYRIDVISVLGIKAYKIEHLKNISLF